MLDNRIIAITVSTNYSDILPYTLANNAKYFDHWYIITQANDHLTRQCVADTGSPKITLLDWDFQSQAPDPVRPGEFTVRYFDKGGAIRHAQQLAYQQWPDHWYLVMDTDILIRSERDLITDHLCREHIYGPGARLDYASYSAYQQGQIHRNYFNGDPRIIGFFQLYHSQRFYQPSVDSNWCDVEFTKQWPEHQQEILAITVDHLGYWGEDVECTHRGRRLGNGFNNDR
jgi:hypothetical protein